MTDKFTEDVYKELSNRDIKIVNKIKEDMLNLIDDRDIFCKDKTPLQIMIENKINVYFDNLINNLHLQQIK